MVVVVVGGWWCPLLGKLSCLCDQKLWVTVSQTRVYDIQGIRMIHIIL